MAEKARDGRRENHAHHPSGESVDEAVRILTHLTDDFERFNSMIHDQRNLLEHQAGRPGYAGDLDRESRRFRLVAAEMATRTQKALEQLGHLAEPDQPRRRRDPVPGLAGERSTG